MHYYGYYEYREDLRELIAKIDGEFDAILAIARGGLSMAHSISEALNNRNLFSVNVVAYEGTKKLDEVKIFNMPDLSHVKRVLIVDDIVDSGDSIATVIAELTKRFPKIEHKTATLFYKDSAHVRPDFSVKKAKEWIEFFWTKDYK